MQSPIIATTTIAGIVSRVVFFAEENGYAVVQVETDKFDQFIASGTMPNAEKGLDVELVGEWKIHPKYGRQFGFVSYSIPEPMGEKAIIAFLSTLKGVKESTATKIVEHFGDSTIAVIEKTPDRLLEVKGIGEKTLPKIVESYQSLKGMQHLIAFLHELGVSAGYAARIYKEYGGEAIHVIKSNPYVLAEQVRGFGFKKADEVALGLGILPESLERLKAAVLHVMKTSANMHGHCYLEIDDLCVQTCQELSLPDFRPTINDVRLAIAEIEVSAGLVKNAKQFRTTKLVNDDGKIYLASMYEAEVGLTRRIQAIAGTFQRSLFSLGDWISDYERENSITLAKGQKDAIVASANHSFTVVTGGAGTGKSSVCKAIISLWYSQKKRVIGVAPTGKASQRIKEATGLESASTIHRLLGWTGTGFAHDEKNPIAGDAFLIDESSMMDVRLAYALFQAIPNHASVMMVGDVNQLPSVGAGNVLRDIIESNEIPVTRLTEVFRQAATSRIIQTSQSVNAGKFPDFEIIGKSDGKPATDALWIKCDQERILSAIEWLVTERLPKLGWEQDQIQVLSPMHKGDCGNIAINKMMQDAWNPKRGQAEVSGFREGDRVIQTSNDYDRNVFNGDIGKIEAIDTTEKEVLIRFPDMDNPNGRLVSYEYGDLEALTPAYSISVHKAQGSEFPVVVMPASMQHFMMLQRNLYYTGITRGKKLFVMVGDEKAIATAVRTNKINNRNTYLANRLMGVAK